MSTSEGHAPTDEQASGGERSAVPFTRAIPGYSPLLGIIIVLLTALVALHGYALYSVTSYFSVQEERSARYRERLAEIGAVVDRQRQTITGLDRECSRAVFDDPGLWGIEQQQFRVSECMRKMLEIMALQNAQIIELLSTAP